MEYAKGEIESQVVMNIVLLAKEFGWSIEYVLKMDIEQYVAVLEIVEKHYSDMKEEQEKTIVKEKTWR